jgi:penicillin amidase
VLFDPHYADQAERYAEGKYVRQRLTAADVQAHSTEKLVLVPGR